MTKVNILGQEYTIKFQSEEENPKLKKADGICEFYSKEIIVCDVKEDEETFNNMREYKNKVLRHEIIHAFIHESGLDVMSEWARNEEMVDFFAYQIPKIAKLFNEIKNIQEEEQ